ncbi:hypothetical protein Tco_1502179 [Tanacetum coccineum]
MAAVEVPQTLEYKGGQLNAAPILEVENFTNWKKRFMCHIIDDQMNSVINCLTAKSTWDDLILYHEGPSDVKESRVMDLKLCYNTFKFKEGESLTQTFTRYKVLMNELVNNGINLSKLEINTCFINGLPKKWLSFCQSLRNTNHVKDSKLASLFGKLKYEENLIDSIYETKKSKSLVSATTLSTAFFSNSIVQDFQDSPDDEEDTRSSHDFQSLNNKNKGLVAEAYQWDEEEMSSDDNEMVEVKVLMALVEDNDGVSKKGARNDEWVKISIRKVHILLEIEDNDDRKTYLDYLCIDLNYVEEQRNNLLSEHKDLVHELNACKEQFFILKQAKLDFLTMQHVNTKILKENKNLRIELKELTTTTETWLNSSNKVNQSDDKKVSIPGVERPWLSKAEGFILPNHDIGRILPAESQRNTTNPSIVVTDSSTTDYDSADESSVCSTLLPPLKKLDGVIINEPSSALAKGNKSSLASKVNSAPTGKLKSVKIEDDPPLAILMKELNDLKLQISKNQSSYPRNNQPQQVPQIALQNKYKAQFKKSCDITYDHAEYMSTMNMSQHLKSLGRASSRPNIPRLSKHFFPPCIHYGSIDHLSNDCLYNPICGVCGSYDHDTNGHNRIISLEREINPRNPQHAYKRCEAYDNSTHTITDHYDIEWFKRGEALQAKKAEALKSTRAESSNANRSKTPTKRKPIWYLDNGCSRHMTGVKSYLHKYVEQPGPKVVFGDDSTCTTEGYCSIKCNG